MVATPVDPQPFDTDPYEALAAATPADRRTIFLRLLAESLAVRGRFSSGGRQVVLDGVDLRGVTVDLKGASLEGVSGCTANLEGVNLNGANLRGAILREAILRGASVEEADLRQADLAGADLRNAKLGKTTLEAAMLEEANLQGASVRFGNLARAVLESADLRSADFWSARLERADLSNADCRGVVLTEADLAGASLRGARLQTAELRGASLRGAVLADAHLQGVDLSCCDLTHVHLADARLEKTRLREEQLGGAVGEELAGDYEKAARAYLVLERNFHDLGDPDAASWAYLKKRRMQKQGALRKVRAALAGGKWLAATRSASKFVSDQAAEWMCGYGESVPRALGSMLAVYLLFMAIYGLTGSVVRPLETPEGRINEVTRDPVDLAVFSLLAMTTSGNPAVGLLPSHEFVHFLTGIQALLGIALTGLFGFVLGNRIRR